MVLKLLLFLNIQRGKVAPLYKVWQSCSAAVRLDNLNGFNN